MRNGVKAAAGFHRIDAAVHPQEIIYRECTARVAGSLPLRRANVLIDRQSMLLHQNPNQRIGKGFRDRKAQQRRVDRDPRRVSFRNHVSLFDNHDGFDETRSFAGLIGELSVERGIDGSVFRSDLG